MRCGSCADAALRRSGAATGDPRTGQFAGIVQSVESPCQCIDRDAAALAAS